MLDFEILDARTRPPMVNSDGKTTNLHPRQDDATDRRAYVRSRTGKRYGTRRPRIRDRIKEMIGAREPDSSEEDGEVDNTIGKSNMVI